MNLGMLELQLGFQAGEYGDPSFGKLFMSNPNIFVGNITSTMMSEVNSVHVISV